MQAMQVSYRAVRITKVQVVYVIDYNLGNRNLFQS